MLGAVIALFGFLIFYAVLGLFRSLGLVTKTEADELKAKLNDVKQED